MHEIESAQERLTSDPNKRRPSTNPRLVELEKMDWRKRVNSLRGDLGVSIPLVTATLGEPQKTYGSINPSDALLLENSSTWWISGEASGYFGHIVFQNLSFKNISGVVLAVNESGCTDKRTVSFRLLTSDKIIQSGETVGLKFKFPTDIDRRQRCIDIHDLLLRSP